MGQEDMICNQAPDMKRREEIRSRHQSLILLKEIPSGRYSLYEVTEYSIGGMGLRSEYGLEPGTDIFIGIENSPYSSNHDIFRAQVVWCEKRFDDADYFPFAMGIKYY